jgi:integrase
MQFGRAYYGQYVRKLKRHFGSTLVSDITADDVAALQRKRQGEGLSGRQINCEVATLRAILKKHKLWNVIAEDVKWLGERTDTGRALSAEDEARLLEAMTQSTSPALYPFFILSLDAGLRPTETRALRRSDLVWRYGSIGRSELIVRRSKTKAGTVVAWCPYPSSVCGAYPVAQSFRRCGTRFIRVSVPSRRLRW